MQRRRISLMLCSLIMIMLALLASISSLISPLPGTAATTAHAQEQPPSAVPGGFVQAVGSQLVRIDQPVQLKGVYYLPQNYSSHAMWRYWDSIRIARELELARDYLGTNVVWVSLPYAVGDVTPEGQLSDEMMLRLRELVQIVGDLDMRLIITLFDGYHAYPMPGRPSEERNITYLKHLLGSFAGDERILGWNIYHKPDTHYVWKRGDKERAVSWLVRMANHVQMYAPNQLVLVNMNNYENLWEEDFDGHTLYDQVDIVMMRGNDAEDILEGVEYIRERSNKPIVLHDFAWATGPPCRTRKYTEEQQAIIHREMLAILGEGQIAGVMLRTLHDTDSGPLSSWDDDEFYRGLLRLDYQPKLASYELLAYPVAPLLNVTTSNYPLRTVETKPPYLFDPDPEIETEPRPIEGTTHYVKRDMRRAWDAFGGRDSFGLPLTEAYKRAEDQRVVQYFEAAVLVLHPEARDDEDYSELGRFERLMAVVRVTDVGLEYTAGRSFPPPAGPVPDAQYFPETGHYVGGEFRKTYRHANGEWRLGQPISEALVEEINGVPTMVQYFERGRLELDPATGKARFGQLGSWRFEAQCEFMP